MLSSLNQMTSIDSLKNPALQPEAKNEDNKPYSFSSNDSTHYSNPKKQKYIFEDCTKSYSVFLILLDEKIKIKIDIIPIEKEEYFYERDISQEELVKINKVFKLCNDIEGSFDYFHTLLSDKLNPVIVKEENDLFILEKKIKFYLPLKIEVQKKTIKNDLVKIINNNDLINNNFNIKNELVEESKEIKDKKNKDEIILEKNDNNKEKEEEKDIENISPLNITNEKIINESKNQLHNFLYENKEGNDILELPEEQDVDGEEEQKEKQKEKEKENSKKNLINMSKLKSAPNLSEDKSQSKSSLLNRKRTTNSDLSDVSFNSLSNENDNIINNNGNNSKRSKNNLAKENILKIFCDNSSVKSGDSNEKFFVKIQKKMNLEKNKIKDLNNLNINQEKSNNELNKKNKSYLEDNLLFSEEDSSDQIYDDCDLLSNKSNKSPTITPIGGKINNINELNENNFKLPIMNNNNNNNYNFNYFNLDLFKKNSDENSMSKNYKKCLTAVQNIQIKEGNKDYNNYSNNSINNSSSNNIYNNNIYESKNNYQDKIPLEFGHYSSKLNHYLSKGIYNNNFNKYNKPDKSYRIIHKNYIEYCTTEVSYLFEDEMDNPNNKSFSVESCIISNYSEFDFIINYLKKKFKKEIKDAIHIYQATEDGPTAADFHKTCDGNTNIVVLIKTKDGKKFGGYTSIGFSSFNRSYHDDTAFIFSIDKREIYPNIHGKSAVDSFYNLGPCFSGDSIKIFDNFLSMEGLIAKNGGNFEMNEDYQINCGKRTFEVEEIEVLEFIEKKDDDYVI